MKQHRKLEILLLVSIFSAITIAYLTLYNQRADDIDKVNQRVATGTVQWLQNDLRIRVDAIARLGQVRNAVTPFTDPGFEADARALLTDFPGLLALSLSDETFIGRKAADPGNPVIGKDISAISADRREALERVRDTLQPVLSQPLALVDSGRTGFIVFVPVTDGERFHGTINTVFGVSTWLDDILFVGNDETFQPNHFLRISIAGETIHETPEFPGENRKWLQSASATVYGRTMAIDIVPRPAALSAMWSWHPELVSALLLAMSMAVYSGFRQIILSKSRIIAENLRRANEEMRAEIDRREQAEAVALEASAAKSRFIAAMSHEIRTPVNAILGLFELLERAPLPERHLKQAHHGKLATERLMALLTNVLDTSRMDEKMVRLRRSAADLELLAEHWRSLLKGSLARYGKPIEGRVSLAADSAGSVLIDELRVSQIIGNLVDNAVKFSDDGQIDVMISLADRPDEAGAPLLQVEVKDCGPGIPQDKWPDVFRRFYQIQGGASRPQQGSGLGLALSREIAILMGGSLELTDSNTGGTTFTLTVPAERVRQETGPVEAAAHSGG